jgi:hypothetical protein
MVAVLLKYERQPIFQSIIFVILSLISLVLLISINPYRDPKQYRIEAINEFAVLTVSVFHLVMQIELEDPLINVSNKKNIGIITIVVISATILLNLSVITNIFVRTLKWEG